jgi:hypothetical protein
MSLGAANRVIVNHAPCNGQKRQSRRPIEQGEVATQAVSIEGRDAPLELGVRFHDALLVARVLLIGRRDSPFRNLIAGREVTAANQLIQVDFSHFGWRRGTKR